MRKSKIDQISESLFSIGVPVRAKRLSAPMRLIARGERRVVFDVLRLVEHAEGEARALEPVHVDAREVVGGHEDVVPLAAYAGPVGLPPSSATTSRPGANAATSVTQL